MDRKFAIIVQDITPDAIVAKQKISVLVVFIEKPFRFSRLLKLYQNRFFERKESEISEHTKRFWYIVCYYSLLTINTAVFKKRKNQTIILDKQKNRAEPNVLPCFIYF